MKVTTEPLLVVQYGDWGEIDGHPVTRKDGSTVETVTLLDPDTGEGYQWTLAATVNGERPKPMTYAQAQVSMRLAPLRNGGMKLKPTVTGFSPAKA